LESGRWERVDGRGMAFDSHKKLDVWRYSVDLVKEIYRLTATFPKEEIYALTSQMCRTAVSVPSNLAEGAARRNNKEFIQFLYIALGSLSELDTQICIAHELEYVNLNDKRNTVELLERVSKLISGLIRKRRGDGRWVKD
jgi:four helix bundle protein